MDKVHAKEPKSSNTPAPEISSSPNIVTEGVARAANNAGQTMDSIAFATVNGIHAAATTIAQGGTLVARGVQTGATVVATSIGKGAAATAQGVGKGAGAAGGAIGSGASVALRAPVNVAEFANATVVQNIIKPSHDDHMDIPIIDPDSPELFAAITALPPTQTTDPVTATPDEQGPIWPMNGRVTAEFGVPHQPFQHTHTGIDISSGERAGVTPIKAFRPGTVTDAIHTNRGLGNHVIIDHGSGVTSVYAHLDSIAVHVGQKVDTSTVLGLEGTTGLSTGPHLHFEIRVNGQVANPRQFIDGNP